MARRKIRKIVIQPNPVVIPKKGPRTVVRPVNTVKKTQPNRATPAKPEIRKTQIMHEMFLNNIKYTKNIKGDIVILGGTLGLFTGMSLLSIIELIFLILKYALNWNNR